LRILQTSDNHIGEIQYARLDPATGLNARSLDYLDSFKQIASKAKELDVDVLLVAGDFFTKVNPHTRYVYETIRIISDIANSGIRLLFVGGNHEAPRLATTLNPLKLLEHLDKVNVVLEPRTITIENLDFVCVPAPSNFDQIRILFNPMLEEALKNSNSHKKILVAHAPLVQAVASSESAMEFFMGEGVDARQIPDKFIHCAFGHIHKFQKIDLGRGAVYYSGSSERFDWSEEGEAKYAILIDVTEQGTNVEPIKLQSRSMRTVVDDDCSGLSAPNIMDNMISRIEAQKNEISEALVRIKLENVDIDESRRIDWRVIRKKLTEYGAFDLKLQPRTTVRSTTEENLSGEYVFPPSKELELYVSSRPEYAESKNELLKIGKEIILEAIETQ
jgi:DNA repair exonuclease SbcCD nuclease subunit